MLLLTISCCDCRSQATPGYVIGDIIRLCRQAVCVHALDKSATRTESLPWLPSRASWERALGVVVPSGGLEANIASVKWEEIGG